ncbi:MAG: OmpA family protein [Granulosicoccus sp.]
MDQKFDSAFDSIDGHHRKSRRATVGLLIAVSVTLSACGVLGSRDSKNSPKPDTTETKAAQDKKKARVNQEFNSRFYVGAGLLASKLDPDADESVTYSVDQTQDSGASIAVGYDLSERFSLEGHIADLGEATFDPNGSVSYQVGGLSAIVYGLNKAGKRARREGLSVFGRIGVGGMKNDEKVVDYERVNDVHLLLGAGAEYGFSNGLAVRAELVAHEADAKYGQLGLIYRFGDAAGSTTGKKVPEPEKVAIPEKEETVATVEPVPEPEATVRGALDSDNDGIPDPLDQCADTKLGRPVNGTGCEVFSGVIEGVNFASASARLTDNAESILAEVAVLLRDNPELRITIEAHTDNEGPAEANLNLSKLRAVAVARYLVNHGVKGSRLRPKAFGESKPRASNTDAAGRRQNRRVEFQVIE